MKTNYGSFFISDWLRNANTLDYISAWESMHNPNFNLSGGIRTSFPIETPVGVLKGTFINKRDRMFGIEAGTDKSFGVFYGEKF